MNKADDLADKKRNKLCKQLYLHLFGKKFPKGWHIYWSVQGFCSFHDEAIYMSAGSLRDPFDFQTLIHEFLHLNQPALKHGKKFDQQVRQLVKTAKQVLGIKSRPKVITKNV